MLCLPGRRAQSRRNARFFITSTALRTRSLPRSGFVLPPESAIPVAAAKVCKGSKKVILVLSDAGYSVTSPALAEVNAWGLRRGRSRRLLLASPSVCSSPFRAPGAAVGRSASGKPQ